MKIQTRLTLLFTSLTATLLIVFSAVIYYSAEKNREKEFYTQLIKEAVTKGNLLFEAEVNPEILQNIYISNRRILDEVEVAIYDTSFQLKYHDAVEIDFVQETPAMLKAIAKGKKLQFYQDDVQVVGIKPDFRNTPYLVTAAARDGYGYNKMKNLLATMALVLVISIIITYPISRFLAQKALVPLQDFNSKISTITASKLDSRIPTRSKQLDEIDLLTDTFNKMLNRLESAFTSQKNFIQNISHELRTPLASLRGELELASSQKVTDTENKKRLKSALEDVDQIEKLTTGLLNLAKAEYDSSKISFKNLRPDELILDAGSQVKKSNAENNFEINFIENNSGDDLPEINGNEYLLQTAFLNLIENACKFSKDSKCQINIENRSTHVRLTFTDKGSGISEEEKTRIFEPFFRGKETTGTPGHGIGLSLTQKIILLHGGTIELTYSKPGKTTFEVTLPRL